MEDFNVGTAAPRRSTLMHAIRRHNALKIVETGRNMITRSAYVMKRSKTCQNYKIFICLINPSIF